MDDFSDPDWDEIDRLLDAALDRPPDERTSFLDAACEGRPRLRAEVESLLAAEEASSFLEQEAVSFAAPAYEPEEGESIADDPLAAPAPQVGPYRLREEIGRGGMSRVFRAERVDGGFDQDVAVKLLRVGLDTAAARRRFRLEQQVLARLQHPRIAALLDGGLTDDDVPYLVMEHVDGEPLTRYCDERSLPVAERIGLLRDVAGALRHAHRNLVVHRDLKPSNVLVTPDGTVKLLDFGIAKLLDETEVAITLPRTRTGARPMTPAYAAPEQVRGGPVSTATDVYQLGVLGYEVLTGHRPHEGADRRAVERAILEDPPSRPSAVVAQPRPGAGEGPDEAAPRTPEAIAAARGTTPRQLRHRLEGDLDTILRTALRKEADRRYASVEALDGDLERHQDGRPIEARADALGYRVRKFGQRHRWGVGIAVAFLGVVVTFALLLVQQRERARQEAQTAEIVSAYLVDLFGAGLPSRAADTVTARTLVRRGLRRAERLRARPVVQAEMLDALGQASRGIGAWDQADSLLGRALRLRRRHLDPPHPDLVASLLHVADTKWSAERYWEARPLYEKALSMSRRLPARPHQAEVLEGLAQTMSRQGAPDSAEVLMRRAIALRRRAGEAAGRRLALDQMELARIIQAQGAHGEAERLYRAGLRRMEEEGRSYAPARRVEVYNRFGDLLRRKGEHAAAATYFRKALRQAEEALGPAHPRTRRARVRLYRSLLRRGRYETALSVARTLLERARGQTPSRRSAVAAAHQRVGHLLDNMGRSAEAQPRLRRASRLRTQVWGPDHIRTHATRARHALCLVERGRLAAAERMVRAARAARRRTAADSTTVDLRSLDTVLDVAEGRLSAERGEWAAAVTHLRRGYRRRHRRAGLRAPLTQRALRALAAATEAAGRPDRATAYRDSLMAR